MDTSYTFVATVDGKEVEIEGRVDVDYDRLVFVDPMYVDFPPEFDVGTDLPEDPWELFDEQVDDHDWEHMREIYADACRNSRYDAGEERYDTLKAESRL